MKKLFTFISACLLLVIPTQAQCDLDFAFINTGSNMTVFFTPTVASAMATEMGEGSVGAFFLTDADVYFCATSGEITGISAQLAAMGDDATTPEQDGFNANQEMLWFYESNNGTVYSLALSPADSYTTNSMSFITSYTSTVISCGSTEVLGCTDETAYNYDELANTDDNSCIALVEGCTDETANNYNVLANANDDSCDFSSEEQSCNYNFDFINTGSNMTVFFTPTVASTMAAEMGDGTVGAFFLTDADVYFCTASGEINGTSTQLAVMGDDATTEEQDGFNANQEILWFYESNDGTVYSLALSPANNYTTNDISFITTYTSTVINCVSTEVLGCTDETAFNYNELANTDDNSCVAVVVGCMNEDSFNYDSSANTAGACEAVVIGCTDEAAFNYNELANTEDNSCVAVVVGCMNEDSFNYDSSANTAGACEAVVIGCTDETAFNYNELANTDDSSCIDVVEGCTNSHYLEFNSQANTDDGSCNALIVAGCTDSNYVEYNLYSNTDDGSCETLIVMGCTDSNATNFDALANTNDGSCAYDLIEADCEVSFETLNTGSNHTIMIPANISTPLNEGDLIGVFFIGENGSAICAGSSIWTNEIVQIVAFGDDTTTDEVDGLLTGSTFIFLAQSGDDVYNVTTSFESPTMATYVVNGLSFISGFEFDLACSVEYLGCTDVNACNYAASANTNDNSCEYSEANFDCSGACLNDSDNDGVCDELEVVGCTDSSSSNYNPLATEDNNNCLSWEDAYGTCVDSGGDDGVTQADVDAVQFTLNSTNTQLLESQSEIAELQIQLEEALANSGGSCEPISVDLLYGWNIIGYTLPFQQDVVATLASIVGGVQIVKDNSANVYWPQYGFNGIGDFLPGQGYQINMYDQVDDFTFPDVDGQRIELTPTVPNYVYDLPILTHPNDIRTLVKVVNMLGQEVNPDEQFKGELVLYLFNDGTTEKRIIQ